MEGLAVRKRDESSIIVEKMVRAESFRPFFFLSCDLETVYILAYVGSGPKLGRQLGALLDTVAEQRVIEGKALASGGNNINGFWLVER